MDRSQFWMHVPQASVVRIKERQAVEVVRKTFYAARLCVGEATRQTDERSALREYVD